MMKAIRTMTAMTAMTAIRTTKAMGTKTAMRTMTAMTAMRSRKFLRLVGLFAAALVMASSINCRAVASVVGGYGGGYYNGNYSGNYNGYDSGNGADSDTTLGPYFIVEGESDDNAVDRFPLKATDVTVSISGVIADIYVVQTYSNEGLKPINAKYVFPASTRACVHGMKMIIGNNVVIAQIKEKEEAKQVFEKAKSENKSASLLEQHRPNVFSMSVANIMPQDIVRIELHYTEMVVSTEGVYQFAFPTVVGPRYVSPSENSQPDGSPQMGGQPGAYGQIGVSHQPAAYGQIGEASTAGLPVKAVLPATASLPDKANPAGQAVTAGQAATAGQALTAGQSNEWAATPYLKDGKTPDQEYNITVKLSAGVPIADIKSVQHGIDIKWNDESEAEITLSDPEDYAGNRDFILEYKLRGEQINCGLMLYGDGEDKYFMLMVQPPERVEDEDIPPREYIFVLDVSGSMYGFPLDTAKELIKDLLSGLRENDIFNLILFQSDLALLASKSVPATVRNINSAIYMIDNEDGGGGTELAQAMKCAVAIPRDENFVRSVVVITDGYITAEKEVFDIIHKNNGKANFFSFGIGSGVNRFLIDGIAKAGLGEPFVVPNPFEAPGAASRFRSYIQSPVLTNIQIKYDMFETHSVEPPAVPTLFAQRPIVVFGKWRGEPAGSINITGKSGSSEFSRNIDVTQATPTDGNAAIRYLWARSLVERLVDYGNTNDINDSVKRQVTDIGLEYSMMTPYTSFVAVLETVRSVIGKSEDVNQPLPLPLNVSNLAVGYSVGSEPEEFILASVAALAFVAMAFRRARKHKEASS
jgi:Ca-activated chloride channel family protein